jgi:hypothetical protein
MKIIKFWLCSPSIQHAKALLFLKLVCFFPLLAGSFHNFELMQNREKTRYGLTFDILKIIYPVNVLSKFYHQAVTPLLRCLGNICSGPDQYTGMAIQNTELLPSLCKYLTSDLRHVRKETLWVLSNMTGEHYCVCKLRLISHLQC